MSSENPTTLGIRSFLNCIFRCFQPMNPSPTDHCGNRAGLPPFHSQCAESTREDSASAIAPAKQACAVTFSDSDCCSICLTEFNGGTDLKILPRCGHVFHKECIDEWLPSRSLNCPVCRDRAADDQKLNGEQAAGGVLDPSMALLFNLSGSAGFGRYFPVH